MISVSDLGIDLTNDKQTTRNAISVDSKDGIEIVSNNEPLEVAQDIADIRNKVNKKEAPIKQEEQSLDAPKNAVDEKIIKLNEAYKNYYEVISQLPANLLDNLNHSYMALERSIAAIPKDILFKFTKSFENIDDDMPRIFLNPNDFGGSNYSFIIEKSKIYYDFFTTVPYQMINNLFASYQEYAKFYKMIPSNMFDYLVSCYAEYKKCLSHVAPEVIKANGYDKVDSIFLNRVMLHDENMNFLLEDIDQDEIISNTRYGITNDFTNKDDHFIIVPSISREDFVNIVNQTGSIDRANGVCARNMEIVYNSVERVRDCLYRDNTILNNMKANMEISTMFIGLSAKSKETILKLIDDQVNRRTDFITKISADLKNGWNKLDGEIGIAMDDDYDDSDYFNKLERLTEHAKKYQNMLSDLMSMQQIINLIKQNGYNIK